MKHYAALRAIPVAIVLLIAAPAYAQNPAMAGKWVLNLDKSQGPQPTAEVLVYEIKDGAAHYVADANQPDGSKFNSEYTAKLDGKEYPNKSRVTGEVNYVSIKQLFPRVEVVTHISHSKEANGKAIHKMTGRFIRILSPDGKEFTSILLDEKGEVFSVRVFDKQPGS